MKNEALTVAVNDGNKCAWKMIERLEWMDLLWRFKNEFFMKVLKNLFEDFDQFLTLDWEEFKFILREPGLILAEI